MARERLNGLRDRFAAIACAVFAVLGIANTAAARDRPLVWALQGPTNTVYIAGSMHLLRSKDSALSDNLSRAYLNAERIVMEVDMDDLDEAAMADWTLKHATYAPESHKSLRSALGDARWQKLNAQTAPAGLPLLAVDMYKPWMVGLTYSLLQMQKLGLDPKLGVEQQLTNKARRDHKPITGLETVQQQLLIFDNLPDDLQLKFLDQSIEEATDARQQLEQISRAWKSGNEKKLSAELLDEYSRFPELYEALVSKRNLAWIPQIKALLHGTDDYLVVVGALHLVGEGGVIHLLELDGLQPTRMQH